MSSGKRAVVVEDDFLISAYLGELCEEYGVEIAGYAADAETAAAIIREAKPTHVLMDARLRGGGDGVEVALAIHAEAPSTRVIFITGSNDPATIDHINSARPYRVLIKPIDPDDLRAALA